MKKFLVAALLSFLAGCSSAPPAPQSVAAPLPVPPAAAAPAAHVPASGGVEVLSAYPTGDYDNLGITDFSFFRPGIRTPSLSDILPELKTKVSDAGGNAFIVRHKQPDSGEKRTLRVSAEILKVKE